MIEDLLVNQTEQGYILELGGQHIIIIIISLCSNTNQAAFSYAELCVHKHVA